MVARLVAPLRQPFFRRFSVLEGVCWLVPSAGRGAISVSGRTLAILLTSRTCGVNILGIGCPSRHAKHSDMDREARLCLLLTLHNTGARISEILTLRQHQLPIGATFLLHLKGKGHKEAECPIVADYFPHVADLGLPSVAIVATASSSPSARGGPLSTDGATYILHQAVRRALPACPTLKAKRISPHVLRHPGRFIYFNPES